MKQIATKNNLKIFQIIGYNETTQTLLFTFGNELKKIKIPQSKLPKDFNERIENLKLIKFFLKRVSRKTILKLCRIN